MSTVVFVKTVKTHYGTIPGLLWALGVVYTPSGIQWILKLICTVIVYSPSTLSSTLQSNVVPSNTNKTELRIAQSCYLWYVHIVMHRW